MKKYLKWGGLTLFGLLLIAQCFQISKKNPVFDSNKDFLVISQADDKVKGLIKSACYDCHSYETKYPWYTYVVPVGQWIRGHIKHGREELNFSEWGNYSSKKADHKLEECGEEIEEKKMPLKSYTFTHGEAKLSDADKKTLIAFFNQQRS